MARYLRTLSAVAALAALSACGVHDQQAAPALTGPSTNGNTLTVQVTPDVLTQDGQSQSRVAIKTFGPNGQATPNIPLRAEIVVGGAITDFGTLSARNLVSDSTGSASVTYTAPAPVFGVAGTVVGISISPTDSKDFANTGPVLATIRLVPPGVIGPPTSALVPDFTVPTATVGNPATFTATITGTGADPVALLWDFGDGTTGGNLTTTHTFQSIGTYLVTLKILDSLGRTNSVTHSVPVTQGNLPSASFTFSPTPAQLHQIINFNASSSTAEQGHNITDYSWNFGDGTTGGGQLTTHVYNTAGSYTVTLQVTDDAGRKASASQTVNVGTSAPTASFTFSPSSPTVAQNVSFDASLSQAASGRSITSYNWVFDDGTTGSGVTTSHSYAAAGSYTVTLTVTDNLGQSAQTSRTVSVGDQPKPTASFNFSPTSPNVGQTINFNAAASTAPSGRTITGYVWIWGDGTANGSGVAPTHAYTTNGTFIVTLTVTDSAGQTGSTTQNVGINALTPPSASFTMSPSTPNIGQPVAFDGSGSTPSGGRPIVTYTWKFGDASANGTGVTTSHIYAVAGTYTVSLTVVDSAGQTNTTSQTLTVGAPPTARISVNPDPSTGPAGSQVTVSFDGTGSTASPGRSISSYSWTFTGGAAPSTASSLSRTFTAPPAATSTTFQATLTVTDNTGATSSITVTFTVNGT
jgi:PKD repeat protein